MFSTIGNSGVGISAGATCGRAKKRALPLGVGNASGGTRPSGSVTRGRLAPSFR
ncbi:molybdopterin oxidoreductase domain protein [Burkholderia pseudomallei]|nr:molybdopterin oxidoreductase domain protein [Burkholderia pseudomallei]